MKRILTAVVLVPVVLVILFKAPDWLYSGFIGLFAVLAAEEYFGIVRHQQENLHRYFMEVMIGLYFLGHVLQGLSAFGVLGFGREFEFWVDTLLGPLVMPFVLLLLGLRFQDLKDMVFSAAISYLVIPYIAFTLGVISLSGRLPLGRILVFIFLVTVWSGDIFAYYIGKAFGRHPMAPVISPKKTWEGAIASALGAVAVCWVLLNGIYFLVYALARFNAYPSNSVLYTKVDIHAPPWWLAVIFGLCVNVAAQLGDLVESAMKRGAGVKDSGNLLPGHGGVLDRIDAMLLAAPLLWYFYPMLYKAIIQKP